MSKAIFCSITWQEKIFFMNLLFLFLEEGVVIHLNKLESSQTGFTSILGFSSLVKICLWILEKEIWRDKEGFTESFQFCWAQHEAREQNEWVQVNESSYIIWHHCHARNTSIYYYIRGLSPWAEYVHKFWWFFRQSALHTHGL